MKAIVIRFSSLGDVVLSTAVVESLSDAGWEVGFVTLPKYCDIFKNDPRISKIFPFDGFRSTAQDIKDFSPDLIVDLHKNQRSILLSAMIDAKKIRADKRNIERRLLVALKIGDRSPKSIVDVQLKTMEKMGMSAEGYLPKIFPTQYGIKFAAEKLKNLKKPIAMLHSGARHSLKNWGDERFKRLAELLEDKGFSIVFLSQSDVFDGFFQSGGLSLEELIGIIQQADCFVGNDSGPVHIAAALGVPSLSIFGPTHPALGFIPRGKNADYITADLKCSPCTLHGEGKCKFDRQLCFEKITPEMVLHKVIELMKGG
ncbi:glycosyltransferase family 9 protein [bacterium]|nr:glycosyltransferase family 9 protein [bacterium]